MLILLPRLQENASKCIAFDLCLIISVLSRCAFRNGNCRLITQRGSCADTVDDRHVTDVFQENCGFKSQELNEQADYEVPDDVAVRPARHWLINDLVLFVDSEDTPRIPKQLFDEVCNIRVAGVPGPVFRGQIEAVGQVLKIGAFLGLVFLVVLSFSAVYKLSTTNQMLATVVGGFLPMILRSFLKSPAPDIELGTVSFKSKMDEVIKNFRQLWPMYDLTFEAVTEDEEAADRSSKEAETIVPGANAEFCSQETDVRRNEKRSYGNRNAPDSCNNVDNGLELLDRKSVV